MIWLIGYICIIFSISLLTLRHTQDNTAFFVNSRQTSTAQVAFSIVASCVGGSATIGMAGLAWQIGTPAFWWLGTGAIGLLVLSIFLAKKVRESRAHTMPEMVTTFIGAGARPVISCIIVLAWLAITAAQFSAMASILMPLTGMTQSTALLVASFVVVTYACIGGQAAVIKSDVFQFIFLGVSLLLILSALLWHQPHSFDNIPLQILNKDFNLNKFHYFLCVLGGSYVVCPMLFGRLLSAKNASVARRGALWAVVALCITACCIVAVGVACRAFVATDTPTELVLTTAALTALPSWLAPVVLLGLFSAIISSADSCLITAATVCSNDILRRNDKNTCRLCLIGIGVGGLLLAMPGKGILQLLLMANDIYVCGVVVPVFMGMVLHKYCTFHAITITIAIILGGAWGLTAALTGNTDYSYMGIGTAFVLSLVAAVLGKMTKQTRIKTQPNHTV